MRAVRDIGCAGGTRVCRSPNSWAGEGTEGAEPMAANDPVSARDWSGVRFLVK